MRKYLIVKLSAIGDVVHTLPALSALKEIASDARVDWLVKEKPAQILKGNSEITNLIEYSRKTFFRTVSRLRRVRYDAVFDLQGLYKSAFLARLARAKTYVGFSNKEIREPCAQCLYTRRIDPVQKHRSVIARGIGLICEYFHIGDNRFFEPQNWKFNFPENAEARKYVENQLDGFVGKLVVLDPGAGWANKRWSPENFAKLADAIAEKVENTRFVIAYSRSEKHLARTIADNVSKAQVYDFETNLVELIALLKRASLFVGGDTGPLQIALALRTPVVAIFGPTDPDRNGPFLESERKFVLRNEMLDCLGCHKRECKLDKTSPPCMQISHKIVAEKAIERLIAGVGYAKVV